jgi:hypothetical protein
MWKKIVLKLTLFSSDVLWSLDKRVDAFGKITPMHHMCEN